MRRPTHAGGRFSGNTAVVLPQEFVEREEPPVSAKPVGRTDALVEFALPAAKVGRSSRDDGDAQLSLGF